ncbi:MAG: nucleoside triphosphate pyrophosphohydrolase [Mangrovibacterium sp.]
MNTREDKMQAFGRLLDVMDTLREKCPWDKEQTFDSLRKNTIEETFELCDAILEKDMDEIKKELGDVLLHIVFYAKMGEEQNAFDMSDVIHALCDKLIYRHPHVYGEINADNSKAVIENWEQLKLKEKGRKKKTVLEGVPRSLPAMVKATRIQEKVSAVGFDWEEREQVWDKVQEEIGEVQEEINAHNTQQTEAEFGDLFFALINAARLYNVDPEAALERTNKKFIRRFNYLEEKTIQQGQDLHQMSLEEMDKYWDEAKKLDKKK